MSTSPESGQASHTLRLRERLKAIQQNKLKPVRAQHSSTEPDATQHTDDDLMLQTYSSVKCSEASVENSGGVSERELKYYQEHVARLQTENSQLKRGLGEKDRELKKSQEALQAIGAGGGSGNVAGRIVELSKKSRELQAELYMEQSRAKKLESNQRELQELVMLREGERDQLREQLEDKPPSPEDISPSTQRKLELVREEMTELKARLTENKNLNQSLKQELRLTQKALTQELGSEADKYSLSQIINSETAWKGRAQQIKLLRKKVNELRAQTQQDAHSSCSHPDTEQDNISTAARYESQNSLSTLDTATRLGGKQCSFSSQSDRQRELLRRMEVSRKETAEKTQSELDEIKRLQTESKNKCAALQARNQTLSQELKQLRKELAESRTREKPSKPAEPPTSMVAKYQATIDGLKQELHKKCVQIENLTQELTNRNNQLTLPTILPACEEAAGGKSRGRVAILKGQLTGSELLDTAGMNGMLQSVSVERDKLRELVGLMQERLEEAVQAGNSHESQLRQLKHSNVLLEKELARIGQNGAKIAASLTGDIDSQSRDVILQRIEIAEDETAALQHRLSSLSLSRKEDTRVYKEMLDASRQIFSDSLEQLKHAYTDQGSAT